MSLLEVGGKSVLGHIMEKMDQVEFLDEVIIVTNEKLSVCFTDWSKQANYRVKLTVVDDGTLSNETCLDVRWFNDCGWRYLFGYELTGFVKFYKEKQENIIILYREENLIQLISGGTADIDNEDKVIGFEEKPAEVNYPYNVPILYIITLEYVSLFNDYYI